jgi:hypothetical protein
VVLASSGGITISNIDLNSSSIIVFEKSETKNKIYLERPYLIKRIVKSSEGRLLLVDESTTVAM